MPRPSRTGIRGLYRDEDGRYRIDLRWVDQAGLARRHKEVLPLGAPFAAAKNRARIVLERVLSGEPPDEPLPAAERQLGEAFDKYLEWCATNGRGDPAYKKRHRAHWVATLGEEFPLAEISELTIERHKQRRQKQGKANGTVNRELVTIKHFLNRCVDWGWLERRPKVVLLREPPPRVRWLTDDERTRLAAALGQKQRGAFKRLVNAALLSGLRLSNLITLRREQVDLPNATIALPHTKSGKLHHVPISETLATVLNEAMGEAGNSPFIFVAGRTKSGKRVPYTRNGVSSFFRRVATEAGVADFHMHDLRHTFATEVRRAGHGLDVVQALLGHASPAMTQRYAHLDNSQLKRAVAVVAPALPPVGLEPAQTKPKTSRSRARSRAS